MPPLYLGFMIHDFANTFNRGAEDAAAIDTDGLSPWGLIANELGLAADQIQLDERRMGPDLTIRKRPHTVYSTHANITRGFQ